MPPVSQRSDLLKPSFPDLGELQRQCIEDHLGFSLNLQNRSSRWKKPRGALESLTLERSLSRGKDGPINASSLSPSHAVSHCHDSYHRIQIFFCFRAFELLVVVSAFSIRAFDSRTCFDSAAYTHTLSPCDSIYWMIAGSRCVAEVIVGMLLGESVVMADCVLRLHGKSG